MNISQPYEIDFARFDIDSIYEIFGKNDKYQRPLIFKEAVGSHTLNPDAIYAGRTYKFGIRLKNINLANKLNTYKVLVTNGLVLETPYYDVETDLIIIKVRFNEGHIPDLDPTSLVGSLWKDGIVQIFINDYLVRTETGELVIIPIAFNTSSSAPTLDTFYKSNKAFMVIKPGEKVWLNLVSGSGAGAGVNLIKGENKAGGNGGDATLCYIEPETGETKPIVFLEGGLGGRLSTNAHQEFKDRKAQCKIFDLNMVGGMVSFETYVNEHNKPVNELTNSEGAMGMQAGGSTIVARGGDGGFKDDIGFRGEAGMSGAQAIVHIVYRAYGRDGGPFIILHPKTMVNVFGVIDNKDLKIKKTKTPMIGGLGGISLTEPGKDGEEGILFVSIENG